MTNSKAHYTRYLSNQLLIPCLLVVLVILELQQSNLEPMMHTILFVT